MGYFGVKYDDIVHSLSRQFSRGATSFFRSGELELRKFTCHTLGEIEGSMSHQKDRSNGHLTYQHCSEKFVCWSRMQAEAGQGLEAIIRRKERERQACEGMFFWGVGNAPSTAITSLARLEVPIPAIFSVMKSKPKAVDVSPSRTVVWRKYFDEHGAERELPAGAIVTSRGESAGGIKARHYALMCRSKTPVALLRGSPFDPTAFRNAGKSGGPVGASQVTALLQQVAPFAERSDYEINLYAWLTGGYWVRLSDPVELTTEDNQEVAGFEGTIDQWLRLSERVRRPKHNHVSSEAHDFLLF